MAHSVAESLAARTAGWQMPMSAPDFTAFRPELFQFLEELTDNNRREWFAANKARYELEVLEPSLAFIRAFREPLRAISSFFVADDRRMGGSLMRVYRDTRFSRNKTPYKTNVGIQFRHQMGGDVHAPGFYVHLAADECFLAIGVWHPDAAALAAIRDAIDGSPARWKRARDDQRFRGQFELEGDSLRNPPRGYDPDHPLIEDLKLKDFVGVRMLDESRVRAPDFVQTTAESFRASRPYMRFL